MEHEKQQKLREVQQMDREYQQLMRQVNELGAAQFTGKAKKDWQAREDALLGRRVSEGLFYFVCLFFVLSWYCILLYSLYTWI